MIVENDGNITSSRAINICDSMERKLTKRSAQELLKTLKKTYWLYEVAPPMMYVYICTVGYYYRKMENSH